MDASRPASRSKAKIFLGMEGKAGVNHGAPKGPQI